MKHAVENVVLSLRMFFLYRPPYAYIETNNYRAKGISFGKRDSTNDPLPSSLKPQPSFGPFHQARG
jgi:hypothetical protein